MERLASKGEFEGAILQNVEESMNSQQEYNGFDSEGQRRQDIELDNSNDNNQSNNNNDNEIFGDKITKQKHKGMVRIGFLNVNGVPSFNDHLKNERLYTAIKDHRLDVIGMSEINRNWNMLDSESGWRARTRTWWEASKAVVAHNYKDCNTSSFQPGGNIVQCMGKVTHEVIGSGWDPTGLGRWSWLRFRGKHEVTLMMICAYRPCRPSRATGVNTTYSQHLRYFDDNDDDRDPRQAILEDLGKFIQECHHNQDQIIVMMDMNEDVNSNQVQQWLEENGLRDAITDQREETPPPTYHRGSAQIDGIFISASLNPVKSGFLEFGMFPSDHRALWIELTFENAFGCSMKNPVLPAARRLKSNDPKVSKKWKDLMKAHAEHHKIKKKLNYLHRHKDQWHTAKWQRKMEKVMQLRNQGWKHADKHCRKLTMGQVHFSPCIKTAGANIALWKGVIKKKKGCKFSMSRIRSLEKQAGCKQSMHLSIEEATSKLDDAQTKYNRLKKNSKALRVKFLEQKAQDIAEDKELSTANVYKQLIRNEQQRESARRIKYVLRKVNDKGVTKIDQLNNAGQREEVTSKEGIEKGCLQANKEKYLQSKFTPCLTEPLRSELGLLADTPASQAILDGTYVAPEGSHPYAQEFFQQFKRPHIEIPFNTVEVTPEIFTEGWKKMKEKTSAGISGLHFGHLKTCATDPDLAEIEASICNLPYTTSYTPNDWKTGVSVMLHKQENEDLVTKLRTITLLEADFNFNNKVLGKSTIDHAERNNLIAKEQYGSRKNKSAIEHAVHKALTYDIIRQTRLPAALCSNDAKSCYDRVVHSIASLAYQRLGVPKPPVHCMLKSIQRMKHHIRTTFGDSKLAMSSDGSLIPFQGILQGNGASPVTWVLISTPLLNMLREMDSGGHFVGAISKQVSHLVGYSYVDDTDLLQFDMRDYSITIGQTMEKMQDTINCWEGGLKMSGGAIVPHKSFVYPIGFSFDAQGKPLYLDEDEIESSFTVIDEKGDNQPLQKFNHNKGKGTLGVILAPDGSQKEAIKFLRKKTDTWAAYVHAGHMNRKDAWQALESTITRTIQYPLPALNLSEKDCKYIMAPVYQVCLPKSAIARTYPHKVLFGPKEEGGMGQTDIYSKQGISKISLLAEHLALETMTGELLRCSIEMAKVEVGVGRNIFELDFNLFGHLCTEGIVKHIWKFSFDNGITIKDNVTPNLQLQRDNDVFLMEQIVYEDFTDTELQHINRCRIYMQATTLSDITTGDGTIITPDALKCNFDEERPHYYKWPVQQQPHQRVRRLWKRALKLAFPRRQGSLELQHTLGSWTNNYNDWKWFFHPRTQLLFHQRDNGTWHMYRYMNRAGRVGRYPKYQYMSQALSFPLNCCRATVKNNHNNSYTLTGWCNDLINEIPAVPPDLVPPYLHQISLAGLFPIYKGNTDSNREKMAMAISNNSLRIVCDGSYKETEDIATAGVIIEDEERSFKIKCSIVTPGETGELNAYRAELCGILTTLGIIHEICSQFHLTSGKILIGCDCDGAVSKVLYHLSCPLIKSTAKHFDILTSISHYSRLLPTVTDLVHIKGHQDDELEYSELDRMAQLNVQADALAKRRLTEEILQRQQNHDRDMAYLPIEPCEIFVTSNNGTLLQLSSEFEKQMYSHIATSRIREYWIAKDKFAQDDIQKVDWQPLHKAFKSIGNSQRNQVSKWLTGFCGVGKTLVKYNHQSHSRCPRCNEVDEDVQHVLQCNHDTAKALWDSELTKLKTWMEDNNRNHDMITAIISSLQSWRSESPYPSTYYENSTLRRAIRHQDKIGWQSFIEGFHAKGWRSVLEQHLNSINSQKSPVLWMSRLQQKLWGIMRAMWKDRNDILHHDGSTVHQQEMRAITAEIMVEWQTGLDMLPQNRYGHLFRGTVQDRLNDTIHMKKMWLGSIWGARDRYGTSQVRNRDVIASDFYKRWKDKLEYQQETKMVHTEITAEWNIGLNSLNQQTYGHLFTGSLYEILAKRLPHKKRWICRVWDSRDKENDYTERQRNQDMVAIYNRWQENREE